MADNFKHLITEEGVKKIITWMRDGGVFVWKSANLSNPSMTWTTPATVTTKPSWEADDHPDMHLTDLNDIGVVRRVEYKRIKVHTRLSSNGLSLKLTDATNERLNKWLMKAGKWSSYEFDYEAGEAVVYRASNIVNLAEYNFN